MRFLLGTTLLVLVLVTKGSKHTDAVHTGPAHPQVSIVSNDADWSEDGD